MTSFKLAIPHRFRKSPPVQISSAHTAFLHNKQAPLQTIYGMERTVNTTGVCRQHKMCRVSAHLQKRPFHSFRYHIRHYADGCLARQMFIRQH